MPFGNCSNIKEELRVRHPPEAESLTLTNDIKDIKQGPWMNVYSGHMKRSFEYQMEVTDLFGSWEGRNKLISGMQDGLNLLRFLIIRWLMSLTTTYATL